MKISAAQMTMQIAARMGREVRAAERARLAAAVATDYRRKRARIEIVGKPHGDTGHCAPYHWRKVARNGEVLCHGEAHARPADAKRAALTELRNTFGPELSRQVLYLWTDAYHPQAIFRGRIDWRHVQPYRGRAPKGWKRLG